jgi:hypothetical protein
MSRTRQAGCSPGTTSRQLLGARQAPSTQPSIRSPPPCDRCRRVASGRDQGCRSVAPKPYPCRHGVSRADGGAMNGDDASASVARPGTDQEGVRRRWRVPTTPRARQHDRTSGISSASVSSSGPRWASGTCGRPSPTSPDVFERSRSPRHRPPPEAPDSDLSQVGPGLGARPATRRRPGHVRARAHSVSPTATSTVCPNAAAPSVPSVPATSGPPLGTWPRCRPQRPR